MNRHAAAALILIVIMAIGLYLRLHHIDYPPIGYHSMKEVNSLSIARGYLLYGDFLARRVPYTGMAEGPGYLKGMPQVQLLPCIFFILWKIFGVDVAVARIVVVLFSLGCIHLVFRVARNLDGGEAMPLTAALLAAILPVSVFFGRNIQPDVPALFFALLSTYHFLLWLRDLETRHLVAFAIVLVVTGFVKGTFLVLAVPLLFMCPFERMADPAYKKRIIIQSGCLIAAAAVFIALVVAVAVHSGGMTTLFPTRRPFLPEALTVYYWRIWFPLIWRYIGENFTYIYFAFFGVGLIACITDHTSRLSRYVIGSFVASILYFLFVSDYAVRHSYYQLPFVPMICFGVAKALDEGASLFAIRKKKWLRHVAIVVVVGAIFPLVMKEIRKHYDILIIGSDVAGRYIKEHGNPEDRVFISYGSPSDRRFDAWRTLYYGILWEAEMRGSLLPDTLERIRFGEEERNMNWLVLYAKRWNEADRPLREYINGHYTIRQIGYQGEDILYFVLEKGGSFDLAPFAGIEKRFSRTYDFSTGEIDLYIKEM